MAAARTAVCLLLAVFFAVAGVLHFTEVEAFAAIVPPGLPWPEAIVRVTGVMEIGLAAGLLWPRARRLTGWLLSAYLLCVLPANIHMALVGMPLGELAATKPLLWLRVALQFPLIALILWACRSLERNHRRES